MLSPKPSPGGSDFRFWPNHLPPRAPLDHTPPPPQNNLNPPLVCPLHPKTSPPAVRSPKPSPGSSDFAFWPNHLPPHAPLDCAASPPQINFKPPSVGPLDPTTSPPATRSPKPSLNSSDFSFWPNHLPPCAPLDRAPPPPQIEFTPLPVGLLHPNTSPPAMRSPKPSHSCSDFDFWPN